MATWFRICQSHRAATAMDGEGARLYGGRWNPVGIRAVYLAESRALAALEIPVHASADALRLDWSVLEVEVPDELIDTVESSDLPHDWDSQPFSSGAREFGAGWLRGRYNAGIRLPSAVIPEEHTLMLNPLFPGYSKIKVSKPRAFLFDPRLA
jgi:RES domain-containing protein